MHDVAGVAEHPGHEVDGLLAADGDDDVVGVGRDPFECHHVADLVAQGGVALTGAVLHRLGAVLADETADRGGDRVEGESGDVGHAAGERDDLGPAGHGEQGADLRRLHALGALGVAVDVGVQPGLSGCHPEPGQPVPRRLVVARAVHGPTIVTHAHSA